MKTVALLSPGDMGHVVARVLIDHGLPVVTCLDGRSQQTRQRAQSVGIEDVATYADLVTRCDLVLSILVPAQALGSAQRVARALDDTGSQLLYVDCNAVAPETGKAVAEVIEAAGSPCVDAGIIGPPPTREGVTRFYASGQRAAEFAELRQYGLDVRLLGDEIGQASGFKMCYASLTKGTAALVIAQLVTASRLGLFQALVAELKLSQVDRYASAARSLPGLPAKAGRWIGEMEEIARTFDAQGVSPGFHQGAADMYRLVHATFPDGAQTADDADDADAALADFIAQLAGALD